MEKIYRAVEVSKDRIDLGTYPLGKADVCYRAGRMRLKEIAIKMELLLGFHEISPSAGENMLWTLAILRLSELAEEGQKLVTQLNRMADEQPLLSLSNSVQFPCETCGEKTPIPELREHGRCVRCMLKLNKKGTSSCPFRQ